MQDAVDEIEIKSSIRSSLMRDALFRGTFFAGSGAMLLLFGGVFLPAPLLKFLGFPFFLLAIALIAGGLLPYRFLKRLETNPNTLISSKQGLHFFSNGKLQLSIPWESIAALDWIEKEQKCSFSLGKISTYGILLSLKSGHPAKMTLQTKRWNFTQFQLMPKKEDQYSIYFPLFSQQAFKALTEECHAS